MPQIIPIRDLKKTSEISKLCKESNEPIFVTKNGYGDMVIMSMEMYEERMAAYALYAKLDEAEEDIAAGRVSDARASLAKLREKHGL